LKTEKGEIRKNSRNSHYWEWFYKSLLIYWVEWLYYLLYVLTKSTWIDLH